jgi:hypothetical protein
VKRAVAFSLLILFLFNFCGYYLLFLILKSDIRDEMRMHLAHDQTEILKIHTSDKALKWVDKNEFDYKGKRYDVASIDEKNGYLIIHCIEDTLEQDLIAGLERILKKQHGHDSKTKTKHKQILKKVHSLYSSMKYAESLYNEEFLTTPFDHSDLKITSICLPIAVPPPDALFNAL